MNDYGMRLWKSGVRSGVDQFFYDLPLNEFRSDGEGLLFASLARDLGHGVESSFFVVERRLILDAVEDIEGVHLVTHGDDCRLSVPLRFDLRAILTELHHDFAPFLVKELAIVRIPEPAPDARVYGGQVEPWDDDSEEEEEDWDEQYFPIAIDYKPWIDRLAASCDVLLKRPDLDPPAISALAKLKYALSRLPVTTAGIGIDAVLSHKTDANGSWGGLSLELRPDRFGVSYVGYVQGPFGGDSDCQGIFACENTGFRSDLDDDPATVYNAFEDWICRWEANCQERDMDLEITDEEETFDWGQFEDETAWERMPSNYD